MTDEALPADEKRAPRDARSGRAAARPAPHAGRRAQPGADRPHRAGLIYALHWAQAILVPILLGVMFSYALTPVVDTLAALACAARRRRQRRAERDRHRHRLGRMERCPTTRPRSSRPCRRSRRSCATRSRTSRASRRRRRSRKSSRRPTSSSRRRSGPPPRRRRPPRRASTPAPASPRHDDHHHHDHHDHADGAADAARRDARGRRARRLQRARLSLDRNARPVRLPRPDARRPVRDAVPARLGQTPSGARWSSSPGRA